MIYGTAIEGKVTDCLIVDILKQYAIHKYAERYTMVETSSDSLISGRIPLSPCMYVPVFAVALIPWIVSRGS